MINGLFNNCYALETNNSFSGTIKEIIINSENITAAIITSSTLDIALSIPKNTILKSPEGLDLPWQSVFPGDGLKLFINPNGTISKVILYGSPSSGRIIFISNQKVTFQNGQQFLFSNKPFIMLNNKQLDNPSDLPIGQKVTYRVNTLTGEIGWMEGWTKDWKPEKHDLIASIFTQPVNVNISNNKLNIKVKGLPGTNITAKLSGIIHSIPLQEKASGIYENSISIPSGYYVKETKLSIKAEQDNNTEEYLFSLPIIIATRSALIDIELFPENNTKIKINKPFIYVNFKQLEIPLNVLTFKFIFDGVDITQATFRSQTFITYHPKHPLKRGWHNVYIEVIDFAGKHWQKNWRFFVSSPK